MNSIVREITSISAKIDPRVVLFVIAVALFVFAAGAPSATGGIGG
jgi:hypothetical protein